MAVKLNIIFLHRRSLCVIFLFEQFLTAGYNHWQFRRTCLPWSRGARCALGTMAGATSQQERHVSPATGGANRSLAPIRIGRCARQDYERN